MLDLHVFQMRMIIQRNISPVIFSRRTWNSNLPVFRHTKIFWWCKNDWRSTTNIIPQRFKTLFSIFKSHGRRYELLLKLQLYIFIYKTFLRKVTLNACRRCVVARFLPRVILGRHYMTVDASLGVLAHIWMPLPVVKSKRTEAEHYS